MRCASLAALALVIATTSSCSQGHRQAWADEIRHGANTELASGALTATLSIRVETRPFEGGAQRANVVGTAAVEGLAVRLRPVDKRAAIGGPAQETAIFIPGIMFERRPATAPKGPSGHADADVALPEASQDKRSSVAPGPSRRSSVPSNIPALAVTPASDGAGTSIGTTGSRGVPPWLAVSFRVLSERDDDRVVGAYGINPLDILVLARGVLTGSVNRVAEDATPGVVHYRGRLGVDLAVRGRGENGDDLVKTLRAHGIGGLVQDFDAWIDSKGALRRLVVKLDQELTTGDRATLVLTLDGVAPDPKPTAITLPTREQASKLDSFGQLVAIIGGGA
ncbi:MAG: hypothetical protein V7636_2630 [Actinomycetota bacterium]